MKTEFNQEQLWWLFYIIDSRLGGLKEYKKYSTNTNPEFDKNTKAGIDQCKQLLKVIKPKLER